MQLKLTWRGNPQGERIPMVADTALTVCVTVVDESTGASAREAYVVNARVGSAPLNAARVDGAAVYYLVPAVHGLFGLPELVVEAAPLADHGSIEARVHLVSASLQSAGNVARFIVAVALVYLLVLVPNIQGTLKFFEELPVIPAFGAGAILLGWFRHSAARLGRHPVATLSLAALALLGMAYLHATRELVINQSLDTISTSDGELQPGAYAVTSAKSVELGGALCPLTSPEHEREKIDERDDQECVKFGSPPNLGLVFASSLLFRRVSVGCIERHPPSTPGIPTDLWRKAGSCQPKSGILIQGAAPKDALANYAPKSPKADRVTTQLDWVTASGQLAWEDASNLLGFTLDPWPARAQAKYANVIGFAFQRAEPQLRIETSTDLAEGSPNLLLSPLPKASGGLLDGDVLVGQTIAGKLSARVAAVPQPRCWALSSGERLLQFLIRDDQGQNYSVFRSTTPGVSSNVVACWTGARPGFAELRLDSSWAASEGWAISFPGALSPVRVSILDPAGNAWGELRCPAAEADAPLTIGPLRLDEARPETVSLSAGSSARDGAAEHGMSWSAAATHELDKWIWGCWAGDKPPEGLKGKGLWSVSRTRASGRSYTVSHGLRVCCLEADRTPHAGSCDKRPDAQSLAWYKAQGPADCNPVLSRLAL